MVAGNLLGGDAAPQPAKPSPSVTQTPEPAPADGPIVLDADAPQGADPQAAYLGAVASRRQRRNRIRLEADYNMIARAGDEYLAVAAGRPRAPSVDVLDAEGTVRRDVGDDRRGGGASADLTVGAWARAGEWDPDPLPGEDRRTGLRGPTAPPTWPRWSAAAPAREGGDGSGCVAYFQAKGGAPRRRSPTSSHGITDVVGGGFRDGACRVARVLLVAGLGHRGRARTPVAPACSAVHDLAGRQAACSRPATTSSSTPAPVFSPDSSRDRGLPAGRGRRRARAPSWCSTARSGKDRGRDRGRRVPY